jgi:hypothetical protein
MGDGQREEQREWVVMPDSSEKTESVLSNDSPRSSPENQSRVREDSEEDDDDSSDGDGDGDGDGDSGGEWEGIAIAQAAEDYSCMQDLPASALSSPRRRLLHRSSGAGEGE